MDIHGPQRRSLNVLTFFLVHRVQKNNRPQRKIAIILTNNIQASQKKNPSHTHTHTLSLKEESVCVCFGVLVCVFDRDLGIIMNGVVKGERVTSDCARVVLSPSRERGDRGDQTQLPQGLLSQPARPEESTHTHQTQEEHR